MNNLPNTNIYTYLTQAQSFFVQYLQIKAQINLCGRNTENTIKAFETMPTQQNLLIVQNSWNQQVSFMQQLPQLVNSIVYNLTEATKMAISSIQKSISSGNRINLVITDNAIASICSFLEQNSSHYFIKDFYRQNCIVQNITLQMSNIEILLRMSKNAIPNFERLKTIINGN